MDPRDTTGVAIGSVDGKSAVDVTPCLVKLNGLPGVLGCLTNARAVNHLILLSVVGLHILPLDVPLDLILAEAERQIEFKSLVVLPRVWLLKACLV